MGWPDSHLHQFIVGKSYYGVPSEDDWLHQVLVEKISPPDPAQKLPVCIKGRRACPPEDVGRIWGYDDFVRIMKDPKHKEYKRLREWYGGKFDPEEFDPDLVNAQLRQLG